MNIAFFVRHFTERGTEVALYDYADYNEKLLNNKSIIVCFTSEAQQRHGFPGERTSYHKFAKRFPIIEIESIDAMTQVIKDHNINTFYTLTGGGKDIYRFGHNWACKTVKHCVFDTTCPEGDYHISISDMLNEKDNTSIPVIPHMVNLPDSSENLRELLGIPKDALVFGRYGGASEFNINMAHEAIKEFLEGSNSYFLFMNTYRFYEHPRIIYLDKNLDLEFKTKFINTCDAMIHARSMGETFGLSIAEFSSKNKPIITCRCGDLEHIKILGDKALIYNSKEELLNIFRNFKITSHNWNAYGDYTPEKVMEKFRPIFC